MALTNDQIEELLLQGSGKTIRLKPIPIGSKRLSWETILERLEMGEGIREGEILPELPEGISATEFYRYSGISPEVFSMEPFSNFEEDIANKITQNADADISDGEKEALNNSYAKVSPQPDPLE